MKTFKLILVVILLSGTILCIYLIVTSVKEQDLWKTLLWFIIGTICWNISGRLVFNKPKPKLQLRVGTIIKGRFKDERNITFKGIIHKIYIREGELFYRIRNWEAWNNNKRIRAPFRTLLIRFDDITSN